MARQFETLTSSAFPGERLTRQEIAHSQGAGERCSLAQCNVVATRHRMRNAVTYRSGE